jgi:hypothetical protein
MCTYVKGDDAAVIKQHVVEAYSARARARARVRACVRACVRAGGSRPGI